MEQMDRENTQKDIMLILKICKQYNLKDTDSAKKLYDFIEMKKPFKTKIGEVFTGRIEKIANGQDKSQSCICCKTESIGNGIICKQCLVKLQGTVAQNNTEKNAKSINETSEKAKVAAAKVVDGTTKVAAIAKQKIDERLEDEKVKKVANEVMDKSKTVSDKVTQEGKNNKVLVIGVVAVIVVILIAGLKNILSIITLVALVNLIYKVIKKQPKKQAITIFVVLLLLIGVVENLAGGSSNDYLFLLDMRKSDVDKQYGTPTIFNQGAGITTYQYQGFRLVFSEDDDGTAYEIMLESGCESSAELFGIKIGDDISVVESAMKEYNMEYVRETNEEVIFKNNEYFLRIYFNGNMIYQLVALENTL